jgi:hypothetical protein
MLHVTQGLGLGMILAVKPEGKRPLRRTRHTQEDNIKMDLGDIGLEGVD